MAKKELIFGVHSLTSLLKNAPERVLQIYRQEDRRDKHSQVILDIAERENIPVHTLSKAKMDKWVKYARHQGLLAEARATSAMQEEDLFALINKKYQVLGQPIKQSNLPLLLLLDGVQDPHNLGACLRVANAAGVNAVVVTENRAVGITPVVRKVAAGAAEETPLVTVTNLANTLRKLKEKGVWLYGLDQAANQLIMDVTFIGPVGLILGAEGKGLRRLTKDLCDGLLAIPMRGSVSSLNVSVAAGVCLFEVVRQRR